MSVIKKPYELSVWDMCPNERKIAIIGSDTMSSPAKIVEPKLKTNVNGSVELTFKLYSKYFDNETGDFVDNPFLGLLVNERVIKLNYKEKWYDLMIKNIQEASDSKSFTYTATSLHINELSKNGFELEFKTELENNQGTITELGKKVLEGTDWTIDEDGSDLIQAFKDEQLYECYINKDITGKYMIGEKEGNTVYEEEEITIPAGNHFYIFYSEFLKWQNDSSLSEVQIIYMDDISTDSSYVADLDSYILNNNYIDDDGIITIDNKNVILSTNDLAIGSSFVKVKVSNYRGKLLVKQPIVEYNSVLNKYVTLYNEGDVEGFTKTKYLSPTFVQNYFVNGKDFTSTAGWSPVYDGSNPVPTISLDFQPDIESLVNDENKIDSTKTTTVGIKLVPTESGGRIYNTLFRSNASKIEEVQIGDSFIFEFEWSTEGYSDYNKAFSYQIINKNTENEISYTITDLGSINSAGGSYRSTKKITFNEYISKEKIKDLRFEFNLDEPNSSETNCSIIFYEVLFFRYVKSKYVDEEGNVSTEEKILYPGDIPDTTPITEYFYYNVSENKNYKEEKDYKFLDPKASYTPVYNTSIGYPKISTITGSESNRFNLIQSLCESFECWANFQISHDDNGVITGRTIAFKEYVGEQKYAGFRYGVNLQSIQRTLKTDQIVTKTIVKDNSNEHGTNGFCSIARAKDNPTGQNYLLDFSYYINQGLLNRDELMKELFGDYNSESGFYSILKAKTTKRDQIISEITALSKTLLEAKAARETALEGKNAAEQELTELKSEYKQYCQVEYPEIPTSAKVNGSITDKKIIEYITKILTIDKSRADFEKTYNNYQKYTEEYCDTEIEKKYAEIEELGIETLEEAFFKKFKYFIQEGSWISEEYYDDNLYYLDAMDVSRTSSKPQVSYSIKVIDVSVLEGYEGYEVNVGDKTYIEDTEFFGWTDIRGIKEPYREEIVVSELVEFLETPEQNTITTQNYKTQFDDLFQRITASTQTLQYASGGYNRAANALLASGELKYEFLQNTILNNATILSNAENESVSWDNTGITIIDSTQPSNIIRLISKGIALSEDGGETWVTGISGKGINAKYITTGQLDTGKIRIMAGTMPAFEWSELGISAYELKAPDTANSGVGYWVNTSNFIRFDQYGIYCIQEDSQFVATSLNSIKNKKGPFYLLRDGSLYVKGTIEAVSGVIGGWTISKLANGTRFLASSTTNNPNIMLFTKGSSGTVDSSTANEKNGYYVLDGNSAEGRTGWLFLAGNGGYLGYYFGVKDDGTLEASKAKIKGEITATSGAIGGFTIKDGNLYSDNFTLYPDGLEDGSFTTYFQISNLLRLGAMTIPLVGTLSFLEMDGSLLIKNGEVDCYNCEFSLGNSALPAAIQLEQTDSNSGVIYTRSKFTDSTINTVYDSFVKILGGEYGSSVGSRAGVISFGIMDEERNDLHKAKIIYYSNFGTTNTAPSPAFHIACDKIRIFGNYSENTNSTYAYIYMDNNSMTLQSGSSGGLLKSTGTWKYNGTEIAVVSQSDKRLKKNISSLQDNDSLFFDSLKPISFQYNKQQDNSYHIGFVAQDVVESYYKIYSDTQTLNCVYKGGISIEDDPNTKDYYCIRYEEFIALNTNEIQKLKKRVAELERQVTQLLNK